MKDFPSIDSRGREVKQVPPSSFGGEAPMKNCFYALHTRGLKKDDDDDDGKSLYLSL